MRIRNDAEEMLPRVKPVVELSPWDTTLHYNSGELLGDRDKEPAAVVESSYGAECASACNGVVEVHRESRPRLLGAPCATKMSTSQSGMADLEGSRPGPPDTLHGEIRHSAENNRTSHRARGKANTAHYNSRESASLRYGAFSTS